MTFIDVLELFVFGCSLLIKLDYIITFNELVHNWSDEKQRNINITNAFDRL